MTRADEQNDTVLTSSNKSEIAFHCYDTAISVLVMLVSRNVFHQVSALQSLPLFQNLGPIHTHPGIF